MKDINVPVENFDLDGFINKTMDFLKTQSSEEVDPSAFITWVESPGRGPNDEGEKGRDFKAKLLEGKVFLFFPFASPGDPVELHCADGNSYSLSSDEDEDGEGSYEDEFFDAFVGYLVRVDNRTISFSSAICPVVVGCGPLSRINLHPDCGVFEQPMTEFIQGFVN